jgi:CRISPR-associated protein Csm4
MRAKPTNATKAETMKLYRLTLQPLTAFGTPLMGDTLFGQLCWALRHRLGNARLNDLLQGYTQGKPFAVVGDAFPAGHIPLPVVPSAMWNKSKLDRKQLKKKRWLPLAALSSPLASWQEQAKAEGEIVQQHALQTTRAQPHNSIDRSTGTTGTGQFAPYNQSQIWFAPGLQLDLYIALDEVRLSTEELVSAFNDIGQTGYGRDASIGLGKFECIELAPSPLAREGALATHYLTLGPCAPQGLGFCDQRSYYQTFTRFGRHGDIAVQAASPFKRPVLLAKAGAIFRPEQLDLASVFIGQGLSGVSVAMPETVQQGYAPVLPIASKGVAE